MSDHLVDCAARQNLPAAKKLALMCFADSADRFSRVGFPGLEDVQQWSGLSRRGALRVTAELVMDGLLTKRSSGHRGHRAEYVVFPDGCCDKHQPTVEEPEEGCQQRHPNPATKDARDVTQSGTQKGVTGGTQTEIKGATDDTQTLGLGATSGTQSPEKGCQKGVTSDTPLLTKDLPMAEVERTTSGSARDPGPPPQLRDNFGPLQPTCPNHIGLDDIPPCWRCADQRKAFDQAQLARADAARHAKMQRQRDEARTLTAQAADVDVGKHLVAARSALRPTRPRVEAPRPPQRSATN